MRSNLLKSLVAVALVAAPTVGSTQVGAEVERESTSLDNNDRALGALFIVAVFAIVLLVYASQGGDEDDLPVSP